MHTNHDFVNVVTVRVDGANQKMVLEVLGPGMEVANQCLITFLPRVRGIDALSR
jgi:hypothetical protein